MLETKRRAYKTEIDPTPEQRTKLVQACGAARFVFNWGLAQKKAALEAKEKAPTYAQLNKELTKLRAEHEWLAAIASHTCQASLRNLEAAWVNFFKSKFGQRKGKRLGFPRFKSRHNGLGQIKHYGFEVANDSIRWGGIGWINLKERGYIPSGKYGAWADGKRLICLTISERAGHFFVSAQTEEEAAPIEVADDLPIIGVDVGIKSLATVSDGRQFENPKALRRNMRKLKRAQRAVSRKVKGSNNRNKARQELARVHYRVSCIRQDATHKATTDITQNPSVIVIESLNVAGMMRNHKIAGAASDANMSEFHRQLRYKSEWSGGRIVEADQWFASSKTCSCCGWRDADQTLSDRMFVCQRCGQQMDRDLNAAHNLKQWAASRAVTKDCGGGSSPSSSDDGVSTDEAVTCTQNGVNMVVECSQSRA